MNRLEWAVRALSQPHDIQESMFPSFVEVADELALNFEEGLNRYVDVPGGLDIFTVEQRTALLDLDDYLTRMSGPDNLHNWTMEALVDSMEWETVRNLATLVLIVMGWPLSPPPGNLDIYVCSRY